MRRPDLQALKILQTGFSGGPGKELVLLLRVKWLMLISVLNEALPGGHSQEQKVVRKEQGLPPPPPASQSLSCTRAWEDGKSFRRSQLQSENVVCRDPVPRITKQSTEGWGRGKLGVEKYPLLTGPGTTQVTVIDKCFPTS